MHSKLVCQFRKLDRQEQVRIYKRFTKTRDSRAVAGIVFEAAGQVRLGWDEPGNSSNGAPAPEPGGFPNGTPVIFCCVTQGWNVFVRMPCDARSRSSFVHPGLLNTETTASYPSNPMSSIRRKLPMKLPLMRLFF